MFTLQQFRASWREPYCARHHCLSSPSILFQGTSAGFSRSPVTELCHVIRVTAWCVIWSLRSLTQIISDKGPLWLIWGRRVNRQDVSLFMAEWSSSSTQSPQRYTESLCLLCLPTFSKHGSLLFFPSSLFIFVHFHPLHFYFSLLPIIPLYFYILLSLPSPPPPCCAFPSPIFSNPSSSYLWLSPFHQPLSSSLLPRLLKAMCWATWVTPSSRRASWAVRSMGASSTSAPLSSPCRTCCCPTRPTSSASWYRSGKHPGLRSSPSASCCGWAQSTDVSQN